MMQWKLDEFILFIRVIYIWFVNLSNWITFNPYPSTCIICHMTCANSVVPDRHAQPRCLTWELHCPLIRQCGPRIQVSGQCNSPIRLHSLELHCPHMVHYEEGYGLPKSRVVIDYLISYSNLEHIGFAFHFRVNETNSTKEYFDT